MEVTEEMKSLFNVKSAELQILSKLGEGSFGAVYFGKYKGKHVAIKRLAANMMASQVNDFFREASLMLGAARVVDLLICHSFGYPSLLALKSHRNVVKIIGMCQEQANFSMVIEFLPNGSLDVLVAQTMEDTNSILSEVDLFRVLRGIALGMAALCSQGVVHRDLAARNILLDAEMEPRISDFGFSRNVGDAGVGKTNSTVGPLRWMSPEAIKDRVRLELVLPAASRG